MKLRQLLIIFFAALLTLTACKKDEIIQTDVTPSENEGEDIISDTTATADTVTIVFGNSGATVTGTSSLVTATVNGNQVTITNSDTSVIRYELSGSTSNGFFKLYSGKKQVIVLNSVDITNPNGAAINIQGPSSSPNSGKRTTIVLNGTNNLADGSSYTSTPSTEDEKAVLFSEGKLVFGGSGSLAVTATGKAGITSDDYILFQEGSIHISSSSGHGVRGKDSVVVAGGSLEISVSANMKKGISSDSIVRIDGGSTVIRITGNTAYDNEDGEYTGTAGVKANTAFVMNGGTLDITNSGTGGKGISCNGTGTFNGGTVTIATTGSNYTAGDVSSKGIKCDGDLLFDGSVVKVTAKSHEGIESKGSITINDGEVYSYSQSDDAINSASTFTINGGFVCGHSAGNDGLDANGNFYIKGGVVYAIGKRSPEVAVDANTERGYKLYVEGGTIIAIGGLERGSSLSQSCYQASSWSQNTWYALTIGNTTYAFKTPSSGGTQMIVSGSSTPSLKSGVSISGGTSYFNETFAVDPSNVNLSNYTGNGGGQPPH